MRLSYWLSLLLAGSLAGVTACGSDEPGNTSDGPGTKGDESPSGADDDDDDDKVPTKDAGVKDGGGKKDSGGTLITTDPDDPSACDKLALNGRPNAPDILIVLDRSGSMVGLGDPRNAGKNRWMPSVSAVKKLTSELTETVAFGLMLFPAPGSGGGGGGITIPGIGTFPTGPGGGGGGCAPGTLNVPVELSTAEMIGTTLDMSTPDIGATPTSATLEAALTALDTGTCGDCQDVPKYILLVTDGQPTCGASGMTTTPEDIAATNAAIDKLAAKGIKVYVVGYDTASDPASAAAMDEFAMHGGTGKHFPVEDEATLLSELTTIAGALVPCEFELNKDIPDPTYVRVEIDGVSYAYETDWSVEGRKIILHPEGAACPILRDAKLHDLKITRECEIVMVM